MSLPAFEVSCDGHGPAVRNHARMTWDCPQDCGRYMTDEDIYRLISEIKDPPVVPVPIVMA